MPHNIASISIVANPLFLLLSPPQLSSPKAAMERTYMTLAITSSAVLTFGGMSQKNTDRGPVHYVYNDVMIFDLLTKDWSRSSDQTSPPEHSPSVRFGSTAVMIGPAK